jgi:hypothetical protein
MRGGHSQIHEPHAAEKTKRPWNCTQRRRLHIIDNRQHQKYERYDEVHIA